MTNKENNSEKLNSILEEVEIEVESRCDQIRRQSESLKFSLQCQVNRELTKLPKTVRQMTVKDFVQKYNGDVTAFAGQKAMKLQSEFDTWVEKTPRLKNRKSMMGKRESLSASNISLETDKTTSHVTMTPKQKYSGIRKPSEQKQTCLAGEKGHPYLRKAKDTSKRVTRSSKRITHATGNKGKANGEEKENGDENMITALLQDARQAMNDKSGDGKGDDKLDAMTKLKAMQDRIKAMMDTMQ